MNRRAFLAAAAGAAMAPTVGASMAAQSLRTAGCPICEYMAETGSKRHVGWIIYKARGKWASWQGHVFSMRPCETDALMDATGLGQARVNEAWKDQSRPNLAAFRITFACKPQGGHLANLIRIDPEVIRWDGERFYRP